MTEYRVYCNVDGESWAIESETVPTQCENGHTDITVAEIKKVSDPIV